MASSASLKLSWGWACVAFLPNEGPVQRGILAVAEPFQGGTAVNFVPLKNKQPWWPTELATGASIGP